MTTTIHKDIEEVDKKIAEFVSRLSAERIQQIKKKVRKKSFVYSNHSSTQYKHLNDTRSLIDCHNRSLQWYSDSRIIGKFGQRSSETFR